MAVENAKKFTRLNLGSGKDYRYGWTNLEILDSCEKDIKHNFNVYPYPFKDNQFNEVDMIMVLEHAIEPIRMLQEVCRVCCDSARVRVIVPHPNSYANITDIQHKANFTEHSFDDHLLEEYNLPELKIKGYRFVYKNKWKRFIPLKGIFKIFLNGIYDDIEFILEVRK
jgi:hypothetical protein